MFAEDAFSIIITASFGMAVFVWTKYKAYLASEESQG